MKVKREDILDYQTYSEQRDVFRTQVLREKKHRRIHLGEYLTFLFENPFTVRYQIQEMLRIEQIVKEADIQHEIETYNELLGNDGQLSGTLLIEVPDKEDRAVKLVEWKNLLEYIFVEMEDGKRHPIIYDERQIGDHKLSAVQYIKFNVDGKVPKAIICAHPKLNARVELSEEQKDALLKDLSLQM